LNILGLKATKFARQHNNKFILCLIMNIPGNIFIEDYIVETVS